MWKEYHEARAGRCRLTMELRIPLVRALRTVLISTYEMGRQPFGLASPAAWLREAGFEVRCLDLSIDSLDVETVRAADLVAFYAPMHMATRMAVPVIAQVR